MAANWEDSLSLPVMPWEETGMQLLGLSADLFRFGVAITLSVPLSCGLRIFKNATVRHLYASITGILLVYYPFGIGVLHALPVGLLTYLAMALIPRKCGTFAWMINFPYLIALHCVNASGTAWSAGDLDFTGGMMVLVLKYISLAVCYQDGFSKPRAEMTEYQKEHNVRKLPSLLEYLSYTFGNGNLLSGPFVEYAEYDDFINQRKIWTPSQKQRTPLGIWQATKLWIQAALTATLYLSGQAMFNVSTIFAEPWYKNMSIWNRLILMTVVGSIYRMRYYFAWSMAEASCVASGLDLMGWSESKPKWGRCKNIKVLSTELCDSARKVPQSWNIGTGHFLRRYVYERLTPIDRKATFMTLMWTQLVSSIWHGLYPGYGMFFVSVVFLFHFSSIFYKWEKNVPNLISKSALWKVFKVVQTMVILNYCAMPFLLLNWNESWEVWRSVRFIPHIYLFTVIIFQMILPAKRRHTNTTETASDKVVDATTTTANETLQDSDGQNDKRE